MPLAWRASPASNRAGRRRTARRGSDLESRCRACGVRPSAPPPCVEEYGSSRRLCGAEQNVTPAFHVACGAGVELHQRIRDRAIHVHLHAGAYPASTAISSGQMVPASLACAERQRGGDDLVRRVVAIGGAEKSSARPVPTPLISSSRHRKPGAFVGHEPLWVNTAPASAAFAAVPVGTRNTATSLDFADPALDAPSDRVAVAQREAFWPDERFGFRMPCRAVLMLAKFMRAVTSVETMDQMTRSTPAPRDQHEQIDINRRARSTTPRARQTLGSR